MPAETRLQIKWLGFLGRVAISAVSILIVIKLVSTDKVAQVFSQINPWWLGLALLVYIPSQLVHAQRFRYIVRTFGKEISISRATALHFIFLWFNQVLPTGFGGDVVKAVLLRHELGVGITVRVAILDRAFGFLALCACTLLLLPLYKGYFGAAFTTVLGLLVGTALVSVPVLSWTCAVCRQRLTFSKPVAPLIDLLADFYRFRTPLELGRQASTSLYLHAVGIASYAILGQALDLHIRILDYVLVAPLIFLFAAIPISFASWGIREIGAIWLFGQIGVTREEAFALSVLFGLFMLVGALPGAILALGDIVVRARK